jgi:hypothetical protein
MANARAVPIQGTAAALLGAGQFPPLERSVPSAQVDDGGPKAGVVLKDCIRLAQCPPPLRRARRAEGEAGGAPRHRAFVAFRPGPAPLEVPDEVLRTFAECADLGKGDRNHGIGQAGAALAQLAGQVE